VWQDQSQHAASAVQSEARFRPHFVQSSTGGRPALRFSQGYFRVADAPQFDFGVEDYAVCGVVTHSNVSSDGFGYGMLLAKQILGVWPFVGVGLYHGASLSNGTHHPGYWTQTSVSQAFGTVEGMNDLVPRLWCARRRTYADITTLAIRVNGRSSNVGIIALTDLSNDFDLLIGGQPVGDEEVVQALISDVSELVVVIGVLPIEMLTRLETHLMSKYGLGP
jgi:hypothetical protein